MLKQVRTEKLLAETEARFVSFMDNNPAAAYIKDEQGRLLYANRQMRKVFSLDDLDHKTVFDLLPADVARRVFEDDARVLRTGETIEQMYAAPFPDGTMRHWLAYRFPIDDLSGRRLLGGVALDVTDRVAAVEALRNSEEKFRSVSESATDAMVAIDQFGNVISWNSAAMKMFGYTADEMLGQSVDAIVPPRFRDAQKAAFGRLVAYGAGSVPGPHPPDLFGLRKDGSEVPIELSLGTWMHGGERFYSGIIRDMTEHRRAQEELRKRDEQLRHSQKLEALGTLAGGVAHEFNNLLQSIQGYTRYAAEGFPLDDPRRQDLDLVLQAANRAASLTRQLLGFSRRQILQYADLDPNQIVSELARLLRPLIGEHIRLELSLGENVGHVHADPTHLQQLLMNLAINARDAMPGGGELLIKTENIVLGDDSLSAYPELSPGHYLVLTVSDNGCGMSDDVREHAFEPFFTTKEVGQGTGLGLAAVYGVVVQHKGTVRVCSEQGVGSAFKILLPAIAEPTETPGVLTLAPRGARARRFSWPKTSRSCASWRSGRSRRPVTAPLAPSMASKQSRSWLPGGPRSRSSCSTWSCPA